MSRETFRAFLLPTRISSGVVRPRYFLLCNQSASKGTDGNLAGCLAGCVADCLAGCVADCLAGCVVSRLSFPARTALAEVFRQYSSAELWLITQSIAAVRSLLQSDPLCVAILRVLLISVAKNASNAKLALSPTIHQLLTICKCAGKRLAHFWHPFLLLEQFRISGIICQTTVLNSAAF